MLQLHSNSTNNDNDNNNNNLFTENSLHFYPHDQSRSLTNQFDTARGKNETFEVEWVLHWMI